MFASLRWLGLAFALTSLAACAGNDATSSIEEPIMEDDDSPRDAGPRPRVDAGKRDASTPPRDASTPPRDASTPSDAGPAPNPFAPGDRTPSPDNIPECPEIAPENPIGSCLGVPIYATCSYTTYHCICDWYHWLCI